MQMDDYELVRWRADGTYQLTAAATALDGSAATIEGPAAVQIYDGAGSALLDAPASVTPSQGKLVYSAELDKLDKYRLQWTGVVDGEAQTWETAIELVGGWIITVAELRAIDPAFASETDYSAEYMKDCRDIIEEFLETNSMCSYRPRGARVKLSGNNRQEIVLPTTDVIEVYSVAIDGVALSADELAAIRCGINTIWRAGGWHAGFKNIDVHYAYGYERVPGPIKRAARMLGKEYIPRRPSGLPSRATSQTIGEQTYRITIAGRDGSSGIPDVDAAMQQFGRIRPVVG